MTLKTMDVIFRRILYCYFLQKDVFLYFTFFLLYYFFLISFTMVMNVLEIITAPL